MLTKILFTALVILVVIGVYRMRSRVPVQARSTAVPEHNRFGRVAAYGFIGLLVLVSSVFYYFHWQEQHRVVTIRVIDNRSGAATTYRAYRKSIKGNRFESLDGKTVILGEAERVELLGLD